MPHLIILLILDFHNGLWIRLRDPPHLKVDGSEVHPRACWCVQGGRGTRVSSQGWLSPSSLRSLTRGVPQRAKALPQARAVFPHFMALLRLKIDGGRSSGEGGWQYPGRSLRVLSCSRTKGQRRAEPSPPCEEQEEEEGAVSNSHLPQPVTRPEPADIPVRGQDTRPVEGPGCHGLAGAPRPRGSAHGGGPGRAGAGGRAKVSTEGGGQHSCARDRVGQRVCPGQQQFQSLGQGSEPHSCWFDSKGHSRGPGRQGLCHAFHKRECRAEPALHILHCLPQAWLSPVPWKHPGEGGGVAWKGRNGHTGQVTA